MSNFLISQSNSPSFPLCVNWVQKSYLTEFIGQQEGRWDLDSCAQSIDTLWDEWLREKARTRISATTRVHCWACQVCLAPCDWVCVSRRGTWCWPCPYSILIHTHVAQLVDGLFILAKWYSLWTWIWLNPLSFIVSPRGLRNIEEQSIRHQWFLASRIEAIQ